MIGPWSASAASNADLSVFSTVLSNKHFSRMLVALMGPPPSFCTPRVRVDEGIGRPDGFRLVRHIAC